MRTFEHTHIEGIVLIKQKSFVDDRGSFTKTFHYEDYEQNGIFFPLMEENYSVSKKGVLRGLHFQTNNPQARLLRVIHGSIIDIAVDLRKNSPTYGRHSSFFLSRAMDNQIYIPKGVAHGFLALEDETEVMYKCDTIYDPASDNGILWSDPKLGIAWEKYFREYSISYPMLSEKDKHLPTFDSFRAINPF